jgi:hypothetical protein
MVAFLDKHFEFTTRLSMNECIERLEAESKRKTGWFASNNDILVRITYDSDDPTFMLDRDAGKNLRAKVYGQLQKMDEHTIFVSGVGRIRPFIEVFLLIFFFIITAFTVGFGTMRGICVDSASASFLPLLFLYFKVRNRNGLIRVVYRALDANE